MTRTEAINRVHTTLGLGPTVLRYGPDPRAVFARQLVDCAAALEMIRLDPEPGLDPPPDPPPPMNWDARKD